jgi:hypothetical protein
MLQLNPRLRLISYAAQLDDQHRIRNTYLNVMESLRLVLEQVDGAPAFVKPYGKVTLFLTNER